MIPRLLVIGVLLVLVAGGGAARASDRLQLWSLYLKVSSTDSNVDLSPAGELVDASCPNNVCRFRYPAGTTVTLSVVPAGGGIFEGWQALYSNIGPRCAGRSYVCNVVMDATKAEKAVFSPLQVWRSSNPGGHVDISPGRSCGFGCTAYRYGDRVTVRAVADRGSHFDDWTSTTCGSVTSRGCVFTIRDNTYISAWFLGDDGTAKIGQPITLYVPFQMSFGGTGTGTVTGPNALSCSKASGTIATSGKCGVDFERGRQIALTAQPTGTSRFTGWGGACANTRGQTCVFRAVTNSAGGRRSATASFSR